MSSFDENSGIGRYQSAEKIWTQHKEKYGDGMFRNALDALHIWQWRQAASSSLTGSGDVDVHPTKTGGRFLLLGKGGWE